MSFEFRDSDIAVRFVVRKDQLEKSDPPKPKLSVFDPGDPPRELSLTLKRERSDAELWEIGEVVTKARAESAKSQSFVLMGRGQVSIQVFPDNRLRLEHQPLPHDPLHCGVGDWPKDKYSRLSIAQAIRDKANYVAR